MALDFKRAAELFMGSEKELAMALGVELGDLRQYRQDPSSAPAELVSQLGDVLVERGHGMVRVGEMLREG